MITIYKCILIILFVTLKCCSNTLINSDIKQRNLWFPLSIIHLNDFHARFEETNLVSTKCKPETEVCIGGYARIVWQVKTLKETKKDKNPIYLNAGDNFQGSTWYTLLRWNVTSHFLNLLPADAMVLGNHEFDHELDGVIPFLNTISSPVLVANMDDKDEPRIQGKYQKSIIIERSGRKIGIIGVIHKNTDELSMTEKLKFFDEIETVKREAAILKENGTDIIIVLSHCGITVDRKIASEAGSNINVVVGGHSHTFLYNGSDSPGPDPAVDTYPIVVEQNNGHKVLIVQASCFSKYLGDITLYFDEQNEIVEWEGNPIYLDQNIPQDQEILNELIPWKKEVDKMANQVIGSSKVLLSKAGCRVNECNFGSFIADAFVDYYVDKMERNAEWTNSAIALLNDGGIRTSLNPGILTYDDLVTAVPYENTIDSFDLLGQYLLDAIEYGAKSYNTANMIQVSGLRIVYNISEAVGERVKSVQVLCNECVTPNYEPLDVHNTYRIIVPSWIGSGGNGFTMFRDHRTNLRKGPLDIELLTRYVKKVSPVIKAVTGRIVILK